MRPDPVDPGRARLLTSSAAFLITLLIGGLAASILTGVYKARVEDSARRDALVIGTTVAQALAQQFEKAARFGIPLKLLPGVESHLSDTLAGTPGITQIVLRGPDGRELRSAIGEDPAVDLASAPVVVDGLTVATVEVATSPAALSDAFAHVGAKAAVAVVIFSALAALAAGLTVGLALDRSEARLVAGMRRAIDGDFEPAPSGIGRSTSRSGPVGRAFYALFHGNRHVRERRAVFEAYAEELLAVDFDGSVRPDVERLRREVLKPHPEAPTQPERSA